VFLKIRIAASRMKNPINFDNGVKADYGIFQDMLAKTK
jgi:hypothetical protein